MYFCMMHILQNYSKQRPFFLMAIAWIFSFISVEAQYTFKPDITLNQLQNFSDTSKQYLIYPYNKKRVRLVTTANIVGYGGVLIALNAVWYAKYPRSGFHFFNDNAEWLQVDKVGHVYSAYSGSRASMELWRWAGLSRKKRVWLGGLSGVAYESVIEILDGFSSQYGFSPGDFTANIVGSGMFIAQEFAWDEQRIKLKFSFHKKNYGETDLNKRADDLYGKPEIERFIKDYNAQTYWLSANIHSFFPESKFPRWLSFSLGYGAEGMFGARSNVAVGFDRGDIKRYRQWYLSPDVDFTKIRTNKKGLKILFFVLSAVKFPAPTLEYSNGNFKGHWIVF
jgi:hypothetical protein